MIRDAGVAEELSGKGEPSEGVDVIRFRIL